MSVVQSLIAQAGTRPPLRKEFPQPVVDAIKEALDYNNTADASQKILSGSLLDALHKEYGFQASRDTFRKYLRLTYGVKDFLNPGLPVVPSIAEGRKPARATKRAK
jgi:hypothetical protein